MTPHIHPQAVVETRHLYFSFGNGALQKNVLTDINLTVEHGEIVLITGPSGSGKTTLLTLIGALRHVQSGSLRVLGEQLAGAEAAQLVETRRQIGYVFQAHNLLSFLTARQNVQMSAQLDRTISTHEVADRANSILNKVGLGERTDYYPHDLSGGQKQRVAIARALVNRPRLVLADEPTAALDSKSGREVVTLMQDLTRSRHCAILMVTHDQRILGIADRVVHIEDGMIRRENSSVTVGL